jgi:outer membrane protein assembly factor BamB
VRNPGIAKNAACSTEEDVVTSELTGIVSAREQMTGRIRWRRKVSEKSTGIAPIYADGKIFVTRPGLKHEGGLGYLYALDVQSGEVLWKGEIGRYLMPWGPFGPVYSEGVVAVASRKGKSSALVVDAWDAQKGTALWAVEMKPAVPTKEAAGSAPKKSWRGQVWERDAAGCAQNGILYFSGAGETVALESKTGKVLWRTAEASCGAQGVPVIFDGRLYLMGYDSYMACLSARDGKLLWKNAGGAFYLPAINKDFLIAGGRDVLIVCNRETGEVVKKINKTGHSCACAWLLNDKYCVDASNHGLFVRDCKENKIVWQSPKGFAIRNCFNPIVSNGRIFVTPQVNGMLFCFEPEEKTR